MAEKEARGGVGKAAAGIGAVTVAVLVGVAKHADDIGRGALRHADDVGRGVMRQADDIGRGALRQSDDFGMASARQSDSFYLRDPRTGDLRTVNSPSRRLATWSDEMGQAHRSTHHLPWAEAFDDSGKAAVDTAFEGATSPGTWEPWNAGARVAKEAVTHAPKLLPEDEDDVWPQAVGEDVTLPDAPPSVRPAVPRPLLFKPAKPADHPPRRPPQ